MPQNLKSIWFYWHFVLDELLILDAAHVYGTNAFAYEMHANNAINEMMLRERKHDNGRIDQVAVVTFLTSCFSHTRED